MCQNPGVKTRVAHTQTTITPEESAPSHIGRFRLEDQVLGGHGKRLWRAYDERLHRMVALATRRPSKIHFTMTCVRPRALRLES